LRTDRYRELAGRVGLSRTESRDTFLDNRSRLAGMTQEVEAAARTLQEKATLICRYQLLTIVISILL
jgi:hypothetical protein